MSHPKTNHYSFRKEIHSTDVSRAATLCQTSCWAGVGKGQRWICPRACFGIIWSRRKKFCNSAITAGCTKLHLIQRRYPEGDMGWGWCSRREGYLGDIDVHLVLKWSANPSHSAQVTLLQNYVQAGTRHVRGFSCHLWRLLRTGADVGRS